MALRDPRKPPVCSGSDPCVALVDLLSSGVSSPVLGVGSTGTSTLTILSSGSREALPGSAGVISPASRLARAGVGIGGVGVVNKSGLFPPSSTSRLVNTL